MFFYDFWASLAIMIASLFIIMFSKYYDINNMTMLTFIITIILINVVIITVAKIISMLISIIFALF